MTKYHRPKSFESLYDDLTKSTFKRYGFINVKILNQWNTIVGEALAKVCSPEKITFEPGQTRSGVLHITVANPAFSLEIQSYEGRIIERIATFFGYKAVSKIRISVKPKRISEMKPAQEVEKPRRVEVKELPAALQNVKDDELREVLASLYQSL
ncbi:MAG: hypothetical protein K0R73_1226 [Candidatus Midichloriaceae bacterium]|jgi:hypothetical protein|nr:hypothetical protein [Candidatus Midichloriaceae bacterium]